jgi:hypothetical protein
MRFVRPGAPPAPDALRAQVEPTVSNLGHSHK